MKKTYVVLLGLLLLLNLQIAEAVTLGTDDYINIHEKNARMFVNTSHNNVWFLFGNGFQSFVENVSTITSMDAYLKTTYLAGASIIGGIWDPVAGEYVDYENITIPLGGGDWYTFNFTNCRITPGDKYYAKLEATVNQFSWAVNTSNEYANGSFNEIGDANDTLFKLHTANYSSFTFAKNFTFDYVEINDTWFQLNNTIFSGNTNISSNPIFTMNEFRDLNMCNFSVTASENCTVWLNMSNLSANDNFTIYLNGIYNDTKNTSIVDYINASFSYTGGTDVLLIEGQLTSQLRMTYITQGAFINNIVDATLILVAVTAVIAIVAYMITRFNKQNEDEV